MSKQLMIYNNIQPLNDAHKGWSVDVTNFAFVKDINSVPIMVSEFVLASHEYPIVFTTSQDGVMIPLVILGLAEDQNLMLDENNQFITDYIPAFIRRYPFVLGGNAEDDTMSVCIDEDADCVSKDGSKGGRLFDEKGEQTEQFKGLVEFLKDFHLRSEHTRGFSERLKELDLFEPMSAKISYNGKEPININLSGFSVINIQKYKELPDEIILELFKNGGMEILHAHMRSLANFNRLIELLSKQLKAAEMKKEAATA